MSSLRILYVGADDFVFKRQKTGNSWEGDLLCHLAASTTSLLMSTAHWGQYIPEVVKFAPDIVVMFDCDRPREAFIPVINWCDQQHVPKVLLANDLFHVQLVRENALAASCDAFLFSTRIAPIQEQYKALFPNSIVGGLDLFVNDRLFHPHDVEKEYDILIYGNIHQLQPVPTLLSKNEETYFEKWKARTGETKLPEVHHFYPLRARITDLVTAHDHKYRVRRITASRDCPCWNCPIRGEDLSREIAKSHLVLATSSRNDRCMLKYAEIVASNSTALGNVPKDFQHVFSGHIVEVSEDMTDEEILETIDAALSNKEELHKRAVDFGESFRKSFGYEGSPVVRQVEEFCRKVVEHKSSQIILCQ